MNTDITLVTGFFDINRSQWQNPYQRPNDIYFENAKRVLSVAHPMVIFIEKKYFDFVKECRKQYDNKYTVIFDWNLEDLKYYKLKDDIKNVMESTEFKDGLAFDNVPEVCIPEYNIIIWSKLYLVNYCIKLNIFNTNFFGWIDFGLHQDILLEKHTNQIIIKNPITDKLRLLCRTLPLPQDKDIINFFKSHTNRFAGGLITGSSENLIFLYNEQEKLIEKALSLKVVDCEQSLFSIIYLDNPEKFDLYFGDWNDIIEKY